MSEKYALLFVDDEEEIISALYDTFIDDYNVFKTTNPKEALEIVKKEDIALVISDQRMPEMTGSELLAEIYNTKPETLRVLLTGYADINAAVDAINKGAIHKYVEKPWNDDDLLAMVASLVEIYEESKKRLDLLSNVSDIIRSETALKTITDNLKEGVCAMEEDGGIFFANNSALKILGYESLDKSSSKKIFDIPENELADYKKEFQETNKVRAQIFTAATRDGSPVDLLMTPIFAQDEEHMVGIIFQGI